MAELWGRGSKRGLGKERWSERHNKEDGEESLAYYAIVGLDWLLKIEYSPVGQILISNKVFI